MEKLQQHLEIIEKQLAEQTLLRQKLEELTNASENGQLILREEMNRTSILDQKNMQQTPNKELEKIIAKRTKEFQQSQAEKITNIQFLVQQRQQIIEARNRLKERRDMFRSAPSPIGGEVIMKTPSRHTRAQSPQTFIHQVVTSLPNTVDRIWTLRDGLYHEYLSKRKPYAGELGIESYEPWQIPDFLMVRRLVEDFVDDFIIRNIPSDLTIMEREMKMKRLNKKDKDWTTASKALLEKSALKLVAEEILLEVTAALTKDVANESTHLDAMFKHMSGNMFMRVAEVQATGNPKGRDPSDPVYDLITHTFGSLQRNRDQQKKRVWVHSQPLVHLAVPPPFPLIHEPVSEPPKGRRQKAKKPADKKADNKPDATVENFPNEREPVETDIQLITYDHLCPANMKATEPQPTDNSAKKIIKFWESVYKKREMQYWKKLHPTMFSISIARRCQGISVVCPSPDHMLVALGTRSGDVLVFDSQVEPWLLVRMDIGQPAGDSVTHLAWSLDSYRILAVKSSSSVHLWLTKGKPASKEALRAMEATQPYALVPLLVMSSKKGDFTLAEGALADHKTVKEQTPMTAEFFPSLTFLTTQHSVCTGLDSGDILKLDVGTDDTESGSLKAPVILKPELKNDQDHKVNMTQQSFKAEVFKHHRCAIIHMSFIGNIGKMVTVDQKGFINIWKYGRECVSEFDCFLPEKKFRLSLSKTMYSSVDSEREKVIFTDKNRPKHVSQAQIAEERRDAQKALNSTNLGDPWHVDFNNQTGLDTYIYLPAGGVKLHGGMVNVVVKHRKTQQLSSHITRLYRPVTVNCTKLLTVKQNPSGTELVFVLLFPEFPPKGPHLLVIVLRLSSMELSNLRQDIELTAQEFQEVKDGLNFSADVTQVYGPTGADYLFMTINSSFKCISLNTGELVLQTDSLSKRGVSSPGLRIHQKQLSLRNSHQVATLGNFGALYAVFYDKSVTSIKVLRLDDGNSHEDSRFMCKAYEKWEGYRPVPIELRVNPVNWLLPDTKHAEAEIRSLLLSLPYQQEGITLEAKDKEDVDNYLALKEKVDKQALLRDL